MVKKPNLAAAPPKASGKPTVSVRREPVMVGKGGAAAALPPSRQGKKALTGFFDPAVSREIKQLALNEDKTVQSLLAEAINDLFVKYGRNPIAS